MLLGGARARARSSDDVEIEGEALSWLVPSYVVLCDHDAARDTLAELFVVARRLEPAVPSSTSRSTTPAALALCDGHLDARRGAARRSQEWARLMTGRDAVGHARDPDVRHPT